MMHRRSLLARALALAIAVSLLAVTGASGQSMPAAPASNTGTIMGTVVSPGGQPVAGVTVTALGSGSAATYSTSTGSDGSFTLVLPAGTYDLRFSPPPPYAGQTASGVQVTPDGIEDFAGYILQYLPGQIAGRVTDPSGRPLPGMRVYASPAGQPKYSQVAISGSDGRFVIPNLTAGRYDMSVLDGFLSPDKQRVTVAGGSTAAYNPRLPMALILPGTAAHASGRLLHWLNLERRADGLPAGIVQNTRWSAECAAHDAYESRNHVLSHEEDPRRPGATIAGDWAGQSSVLSLNAPWRPGHNPWENAPIHLIQLFSPSLSVIGIDESHRLDCATTWPGLVRTPPAHDTVSTYPGNGVRGVPPSEDASEVGFVPGDFVGIPQGRTAGRELFVYLNQAGQLGQAQVKILHATLSGPHGRVAVRWVDNSTHTVGPDL